MSACAMCKKEIEEHGNRELVDCARMLVVRKTEKDLPAVTG